MFVSLVLKVAPKKNNRSYTEEVRNNSEVQQG